MIKRLRRIERVKQEYLGGVEVMSFKDESLPPPPPRHVYIKVAIENMLIGIFKKGGLVERR